jgi:hypothetical protein
MFKRLVDFSAYETIGIAVMVVFFLAFVAMLVRVLVLKKSHTEEMERLPLDDGTERDFPRTERDFPRTERDFPRTERDFPRTERDLPPTDTDNDDETKV